MKIYIETLGCQMNKLDSELAAGALRAAGHEITDDHRQADVVLYNTCSVRKQAENKAYSRLGAEGQRKAAGKSLIVGVLGCMAQREGEELRAKYPQVDLICSPGRLHELPQLIADAAEGKTGLALDPTRKELRDEESEEKLDHLDLSRDTHVVPSAFQAFVRVMRGCDKFCTYCVVPFVRGPERSRDPQHIVEEVRRLVDSGRSEITLLGQTVNSYHFTADETTVRFSDLLERVSAVAGLRRLRFVTSHPNDFGDDVLQAMRDLPNVCPYIHCPAQSGSDAMLKAMKRDYTRAQYDEWVDRARAIVPDVVLAGDFIVGFPGESEQDHEASAELIRRSGYKNSFIFKYSPRPGTFAAKMLTDDVPLAVKRRRNNELLAVQEEVGLTHHRGYVGREVEVLAEGLSPKSHKQASEGEVVQLIGRTRGDHIVVFDGRREQIGQYLNVQIVETTSLTLFGRVSQHSTD